jgi:hypothetical protein
MSGRLPLILRPNGREKQENNCLGPENLDFWAVFSIAFILQHRSSGASPANTDRLADFFGLLPTELPLFSGCFQFPTPFVMDLLLTPGQHAERTQTCPSA